MQNTVDFQNFRHNANTITTLVADIDFDQIAKLNVFRKIVLHTLLQMRQLIQYKLLTSYWI
ncbi:hypothetical protein D3C75_1218400 [compost metagenome]